MDEAEGQPMLAQAISVLTVAPFKVHVTHGASLD